MEAEVDARAVAAVRAFNREWTARIGMLDATLLQTPYSLTEARVLLELNQVDHLPISTLLRALRVDAGYLSRLLRRLAGRGLVQLSADTADGRRRLATLTASGRDAADDLDRRSRQQLRDMLGPLPPEQIARAVEALGTIRSVLGEPVDGPVRAAAVTLRNLLPGDLGWIVGRHGALYAGQFSWDMSFEALVARIVADFASDHDPARERAWIAEVDGVRAGCVLCVHAESGDPETAQLRLLLVEPSARGLGVGSALVRACVDFARVAGYRKIVLWTNDVLTAARRIYEREGFTLISEEPHASFGHELVGQYWGTEL